jgi:Tol biopolymer transport system component
VISGARQPVRFSPPGRREPFVGLYPVDWSSDSGTALFRYQRFTIDCPREVSLNGADLVALDVVTGAASAIVADVRGAVGDVRISPDGRSVAYVDASGAGQIAVRLATSGNGGARILGTASGEAAELAAAELLWSPDATSLAYTVSWSVRTFTLATGFRRGLHQGEAEAFTITPPRLVGYSRDGRELAFMTGERRLHVVSLEGSSRRTWALPVPAKKTITGIWGTFD